MPSNPVTVKKDLKANWKCGKEYKRSTSRALRRKPVEEGEKRPHAKRPKTFAEKDRALRHGIYAYELLLARAACWFSPLGKYREQRLRKRIERLWEKKRALWKSRG